MYDHLSTSIPWHKHYLGGAGSKGTWWSSTWSAANTRIHALSGCWWWSLEFCCEWNNVPFLRLVKTHTQNISTSVCHLVIINTVHHVWLHSLSFFCDHFVSGCHRLARCCWSPFHPSSFSPPVSSSSIFVSRLKCFCLLYTTNTAAAAATAATTTTFCFPPFFRGDPLPLTGH